MHWWDRYPERLEREYHDLREHDIGFKRDEEAFSVGVLRLELEFKLDGETLPLIVTHPDLYPYFSFQVSAPSLELEHHLNPLNKYLCLIGRDTFFLEDG